MKTIIRYVAVAATLLSTAVLSLQAQALRTGYFSDSYVYRHQMNPALANADGYVSMPILGNMQMDLGMNFGVKDFIYTMPDGKLTTFMNGSVDKNEFESNLKDKSKLNLNYDMSILSVGFNAWKGYNTIDLGVHARAGVTLSKDLFLFMKSTSNGTYDLGDIKANGMGWADLSLGHSRQINDAIRVGGKIKFLFGLAYADADFAGSSATFSDDAWKMNLNGEINIAGGGTMTTKKGTNEMSGYEDFKPGNGFGMAFDLGATYDMKDIVDGLKVSAAVTDLGWISWDCAKAAADHKQFKFDGFHDMKLHSGEGTVGPNGQSGYNDGTLDEQWKRIEDDLEELTKFDVKSQSAKIADGIGATVTAGVEYEIPVYKKISFGALYTQRFSKAYGYAEGRLNVNYAPSHIFDMSFSGCASTYGTSLGAILNLHVTGFNLFAGFDRLYTGSVNSDMIPLESGSMNFSFGLNFPFGK
ncbi:MAG: hypothetical protein KBT20_07870 [Bacteroidales bacterium]|nr:hypothetical protein [Candidatus Liminaster caballi]